MQGKREGGKEGERERAGEERRDGGEAERDRWG